MRTAFWIALAGVSLMATGLATTQNLDSIRWVGSLENAKKQAEKRNVPVLVAVLERFDPARDPKRHEAVQQTMAIYRNGAVVKESRKLVCVAVCLGWTPAAGDPDARFLGRINGKQNQALEQRIRADYFPSGTEIVVPQHLILDPHGKLLDRYLMSRSSADFLRILKNAVARVRGEAPVDAVTASAHDVVAGLKSDDPEACFQAFRQALAILGTNPRDGVVRGAAEQYLRTLKAGQVAKKALDAIDQAGTEGALLLLEPCMKHRNTNLRRRAMDVLAGAPAFQSMLKPLMQRVRTERELVPLRSLVRTLEHYAETFPKETLPSLNKLVSHKEDPIKVLATLAAARPGNDAIYGKLLARARTERNVEVRVAAILGLALMQARKALSTLEGLRAQEPREANVRQALDTAIAHLGGESQEPSVALQKEIRQARREAGAADDDRKDGKGKKDRGHHKKGRGGRRK